MITDSIQRLTMKGKQRKPLNIPLCIYCIMTGIVMASCNHGSQTVAGSKVVNEHSQNTKELGPVPGGECSVGDPPQLSIAEYKGITFFTENTMRGRGVVHLSINQKVDILNLDKTLYGSIAPKINGEFTDYEINLPKTVIARQIIPYSELRIFEFDSESPQQDNTYLTVYINKERKLILKKDLSYRFLSWNDYIKSAFVRLTAAVQNISIAERKYMYQVVEIKDNAMSIRSVPKSACDYVEDYKPISKWIKWRTDHCKLIEFNFCY